MKPHGMKSKCISRIQLTIIIRIQNWWSIESSYKQTACSIPLNGNQCMSSIKSYSFVYTKYELMLTILTNLFRLHFVQPWFTFWNFENSFTLRFYRCMTQNFLIYHQFIRSITEFKLHILNCEMITPNSAV